MIETIGKYRIDGQIGRGGFGIVYRAWDPVVGRHVAIKMLTVQGDEDLLARFRNEAAAAGSLHHRNIVTVHDFGEHEGTPYMVMQLLEGETLQQAMQRTPPLGLLDKMNILVQVADGLHHAHTHGIVHRDVKPPNIMILPDGSVQIMDFGIARVTASTSRQTRTGFLVGTALYMAPEQFLAGRAVDHRADIWAFGVIAYELLTGRHPFAAEEETGTLYRIAHVDPAPLTSLAPDCPLTVEEVVHRLLAKDPDLRYESLKDATYDLHPAILDLRRDEAASLVERAQQFAAEQRYEEAQTAARSSLELDPGNRDAHALLQAARQHLQRRSIQPKVEALLRKADTEVEARSWQPAIDALESALRLSPADTSIRVRLDDVRNRAEASRRAQQLATDAQREFKASNLDAALSLAKEAAQLDTGNVSATHLIERIHRDRATGRARALADAGETAALRALAAECPDNREIQAVLERYRQQCVARAQALSEQGDTAAVQALAAEWPDDTAIRKLAEDAQREELARSRIRAELDAGRLDSAGTMLSVALARFPRDPHLLALRAELDRKTAAPPPEQPARELPSPEPLRPVQRRSQMPLVLAGAVAALAALGAAVILLRPDGEPARPAAQPPAAEARPDNRPAPIGPAATAPGPAPAARQPQSTALPPVAARKQPVREEPEAEPEPTPAPPPAETTPAPSNRVGATAVSAGRVIPVPPKRTWTGPSSGKFVWTGQLPPGSRVIIGPDRVVEGPGMLGAGTRIPPFSEIEFTAVNPSGSLALATAGQNLAIGNTGNVPLTSIEIGWRVRE